MIAWRQGQPQKGDWIQCDDGARLYCTRACVPLGFAAADFVRCYRPTEKTSKTLTFTDLFSGKSLEVSFEWKGDENMN
jgi:hypothetical protein